MTPQFPRCNLVVIRSPDIDRAAKFYELLGMTFTRHAHLNGPTHYSAERDGFVFEIYPQPEGGESTRGVRLGFEVEDIDSILPGLIGCGGMLLAKPASSKWGRRAVIKDLDGNSVELTTR